MKSFLALFLFLFTCQNFAGQDTTAITSKELKHGIQFQIESLLELKNFSGYTFSYRYNFSNNAGLRVGFFAYIGEDDYDLIQQRDTVAISPPFYANIYNYKISVQYLFSLMHYEKFSLILGAGPFFSHVKRDRYNESLGTASVRKSSEKEKSYGYGIDLIGGVEYRLFDNVFLSGEYGITLSKESGEIEYESTEVFATETRVNRIAGDRNRLLIRGLGVNLGISVFF